MGAGAVIYATGKSKLTELGGLVSKMKAVAVLYIIGGLAISGAPFFNGFISKSMVVSAAGELHLEIVMLLLTIATIGTFLHSGLKLPYFTWFSETKSDITSVKPIPNNMILAMGFGAFFCTLLGIFPNLLYQYLPYPVNYEPYTVYHFVEMIQILVFTYIGFWILRKKLEGDAKIALDTDWFYRKPAPAVRLIFVKWIDRAFGIADEVILSIAGFLSSKFKNPMKWLNPFTEDKNEASSYSPAMEVVMSFILLGFLVFSLFYII